MPGKAYFKLRMVKYIKRYLGFLGRNLSIATVKKIKKTRNDLGQLDK